MAQSPASKTLKVLTGPIGTDFLPTCTVLYGALFTPLAMLLATGTQTSWALPGPRFNFGNRAFAD